MVEKKNGSILFSYANKNGCSTSVIGTSVEELIDVVVSCCDATFARRFYIEFKDKLSKAQYERLRNFVINSGTTSEILEFYKLVDVSEANVFANSFMKSTDYQSIIDFISISHNYIDHEAFENVLMDCDVPDKGKYIAQLVNIPGFNKERIFEELLRIGAVFEQLYYFRNYENFDLRKISEVAIDSHDANKIFEVAFFISNKVREDVKLLPLGLDLENAFLKYCNSGDLFYDYMIDVGCHDEERFLEVSIIKEWYNYIRYLYKKSNRKKRKWIYQLVMKIGNETIKESIKSETSLLDQILWKIF